MKTVNSSVLAAGHCAGPRAPRRSHFTTGKPSGKFARRRHWRSPASSANFSTLPGSTASTFRTGRDEEDEPLSFTPSTIEELNLLLQFDSSSLERGIKVHSSARQEVIAACRNLFDRGLVSQADGGYLTDAGIEALAHAQVLAELLNEKDAAPSV
jgi:uncharacterized protein (TIGR02647 family)